MMLGCGVDSNENGRSCNKVDGESSDELSASAADSEPTAAMKTELEEYHRVIQQQHELLLQVN